MVATVSGIPSSELADAAFQAVITSGLAVFAGILYRRLPERWFAWWAAAWGLYVLRLVAIILYVLTGNLMWLFWHQVTTAWVALAILWAALVFSRGARWKSWYVAIALFPMLWAWVAIHALSEIALVALPTVILIAGATLWTGYVFWRYAQRNASPEARFVAIAFTLWGLHHLDYTILRARGAWEPWGYFLDIIFELSVGVGFGVMVLTEFARRLSARTDELGHLSALMVRQHEAERRRVSRELHDETAQTLSAVKMEIGMLREGTDPETTQRFDRVLALVDEGIGGIRRVMNDLRPALLDDLGLVPAIRSLASEVATRGRVVVNTDLPEATPRLAPEAELAVFRAAQEALANVVRHASATHVTVRLRASERQLTLVVRDDGHGVAFNDEGELDTAEHLGLAGMRERITALGGAVTLSPARPNGLVVTVEVPMKR